MTNDEASRGREHVLALLARIVAASNPQEPRAVHVPGDDLFARFGRRRGLPIGNLTSQWLATIYLDPVDHLVSDRLGLGYVRYGDDMVAFADGKPALRRALREIRRALAALRLRVHPVRCRLLPVAEGTLFLGFQVFPRRRRLDPGNVRRFRRRLAGLRRALARRCVRPQEVTPRIRAWIAHAAHADTVRLRGRVLTARLPALARSGRSARTHGP